MSNFKSDKQRKAMFASMNKPTSKTDKLQKRMKEQREKKEEYTPKNLEKWERADNYAGEDFSDYYVVYAKSRDADTLTESNYEQIEGELKGTKGVIKPNFRDWASGYVDVIMVDKNNPEAVKKADEISGKLKEYPVLNDEDYYQRKRERAQEYWDKQYTENDKKTAYERANKPIPENIATIKFNEIDEDVQDQEEDDVE